MRARRELQPLAYLAGDRGARGAYVATLARNRALVERGGEILDAAAARGLALLPLKGLVFAEALWGDAGARPMSDLDLAVRPGELHRAVELMRALGFRPAFAPRARFSPRHAHDVAFLDEKGVIAVEIHHRLYHELGADGDVEPLFARAIVVDGRPAPSWDDHLFVSCVHAATHAFGDSAIWLIDTALLVERADAAAAEREATRRRARFAYRSALRTAHALFPNVPAPPPVGDERVRERLLDLALGRERMAKPPGRIASLLARALLTESPRDAAREVLRKLELRLVELAELRR